MKGLRGYRNGLTLVLIISSVLVGLSCAKAAPEDRLNMACVTRLQLPLYPPIARSSLVTVRMTAAISLANEGSVQSITFEGISGTNPDLAKLFFPEVERSLRASQFASTCGDKTVRLIFSFQMDRHPPAGVWFEFPNRFEIEAELPMINTDRQDPAPVR